MRYLVTGGAGFLGINLIRFLVEKGHEVTSIDIMDFDYEDMKNKIRIVTGDVRDQKTVEKSLEDVDIVVHGAAALPLYSKEDIYSTDVGGTEMVLSESFKKGIERVIFISSTAVYG